MQIIAQKKGITVEFDSGVIFGPVDITSGTHKLAVEVTTSFLPELTIEQSTDGDSYTELKSIAEDESETSHFEVFEATGSYLRIKGSNSLEVGIINLYLMAEEVIPDCRICTLADIKNRLGISTDDTEHDTVLKGIIAGVESAFDDFTDRDLIATAADITEYYTLRCPQLQVKSYPIISISSIKYSYDYDFDNADALTANTDYRLLNKGKPGIMVITSLPYPARADSLQVTYRGGYAAAGANEDEGQQALPYDLREAAVEQACFIYKRKDDIGLSSVSFDGGSIKKFSDMDLLPFVKRILQRHRRKCL